MSEPVFPKAESADVALLLEGTFPFVSGGVSSWVNQIIRAFPEIRFAIVFLGSRRSDYGAPKYALPDNVVHVETHFMHDDLVRHGIEVKPSNGDPAAFARVMMLHETFRQHGERDLSAFAALAPELAPGGCLPLDDFLHSEQA